MRLIDGTIEIIVADRGPGFDTCDNDTGDKTGLGLAGLRERVESLGGSFHAANRSGGGAVLTMALPLNWGAE